MTTKRTPALFTIFNTSPTGTEQLKVTLEIFYCRLVNTE